MSEWLLCTYQNIGRWWTNQNSKNRFAQENSWDLEKM